MFSNPQKKSQICRYKAIFPGDEERTFKAEQEGAENRFEHCLKKTRTARRGDGAEKVLVTTDTDQFGIPSAANEAADGSVQISKVKTMKDQAVMKLEMKKNSQIAEMAEKTAIGAVVMCAV